MSDEEMPNEGAQLEVPPELVNDLRQLQKERLLVPPQIDAAALGRPRLHLARIRDLRARGGAASTVAAEDLALAARASVEAERQAGNLAPRGTEPFSLPRNTRNRFLWGAATVAAAAVLWLLWRLWTH
jgi:hypothetical protein